MPAKKKAALPSLRRSPSCYAKRTTARLPSATSSRALICTHALDDDGTPLDDPLVQVEHILNNLWERRQGVRALVAGAGSRVFADCLRKTIMSRAAETVSADPAGPAGTMDRSFLLHHIASSFVATVQWWAWHNFQAPKEDVAKDYLSAIKPLFG